MNHIKEVIIFNQLCTVSYSKRCSCFHAVDVALQNTFQSSGDTFESLK